MLPQSELKTRPARRKGSNEPYKGPTRLISAHVPEEVYEKIKEIAYEERTSIQRVITEGINKVFAEKKIDLFSDLRQPTGRPRKAHQPG